VAFTYFFADLRLTKKAPLNLKFYFFSYQIKFSNIFVAKLISNIMSNKFHWGHGVSIVLGVFIIFILTFVYKTLVKPEYDHKLVSEEYYKEELHFQDEINSLNNASQLKENVKIQHSDKGIEVVFPGSFDPKKIEGYVDLQRANDSKLDLKIDLNLDSLSLLIPSEKLIKGTYNIKVVWNYEKIPYQLNEKYKY